MYSSPSLMVVFPLAVILILILSNDRFHVSCSFLSTSWHSSHDLIHPPSFYVQNPKKNAKKSKTLHLFSTSHPNENNPTTPSPSSSSSSSSSYSHSKPRIGWTHTLLNLALASPLWKYVLVPQARANIIKTAEDNGIPWKQALQWIQTQNGPWQQQHSQEQNQTLSFSYPSYYIQPFHAYEKGNLCWEAAMEQELASRAIGVRNFPNYGNKGEDVFRQAFEITLERDCEALVPIHDAVILDLGCGTGISTRRLAQRYPNVSQIMGMDMSPYFIQVGNFLWQEKPKSLEEGGPWVTSLSQNHSSGDKKNILTWVVGDATCTQLPNESVDIVNLSFVLHELPISISCLVFQEAYRILKPQGGQLWMSEMDFEAPAYAAQRANPLLFSLLRATEPYLDEYADGCHLLRQELYRLFDHVLIAAATGRHYALVAKKIYSSSHHEKWSHDDGCIVEDKRFRADGSYAVDDTHLPTWESRSSSNSNSN